MSTTQTVEHCQGLIELGHTFYQAYLLDTFAFFETRPPLELFLLFCIDPTVMASTTHASKPSIVCIPSTDLTFIEESKALFELFKVLLVKDLEQNTSLAEDVAGLVVSSETESAVKARVWIPQCPNLKAIASLSAGYEHSYPIAKKFGIPFANCPSVHTDATADHAMALMLASGCGLMPYIRATILTDKPHSLPSTYRSPGVCHTTLGIVGLGSIGSAIARRAKGFDLKVLYHSQARKSKDIESALHVTFCNILDEMLPECDYVIASCSLTESTEGMFGDQQFKLTKSSATFINIARGKVVDTDALVNALKTGEIRQAALDVTDPQPLFAGHPLLDLANVIVTPHMAALTSRGIASCFTKAANNLKAAIMDGSTMPDEIAG